MKMTLCFLFIFIAFMFIYISSKTAEQWVKRITLIYSIMFSLASIAAFGLYVFDHQQTIVHAASHFFIKPKYTNGTNPKESTLHVHEYDVKEKVHLDAPLIEQLPELPRGCEVTSLGMLLAYNGIQVDKMELAENVKKNPAPYRKETNQIHFGNPHNGFVGDMYSFDAPGLGVYHQPIAELARKYVNDKTVLDLTGGDFSTIIQQLNLDRTVWVIINSHYKLLPDSEFITWHTEDGPIQITYREHSVLITGYDEKYIYFNDPLNYRNKAPREDFQRAWEQMGKQAITIY